MDKKNSSQCLDSQIIILGGGIAGITCGITMQSLGYQTTIVSEKFPLVQEADDSDKLLATTFAMASAYPHFLRIRNLERISNDSQSVLASLCNKENSGVERQRIFEVFEFEPPANAAPLSEKRMQFRTFEGRPQKLKLSIDPPSRKLANYIWGWNFVSYFADMPVYMNYLWSYYLELGGKRIQAKIGNLEEFNFLKNRVIINSCGLGSIQLCSDKSECIILRGKQVLVDAPGIFDSDGLRLAYNYTPTADVFSRADGTPEYVHFFSRSAEWVLGQTRERGKLLDGDWQGIVSGTKELSIDGIGIPQEILTLNEDILNNWKQRNIPRNRLKAREGYRYYRDPEKTGSRLEKEQRESNLLIHNYGLSGSGITMSWGCAIECARMIFDYLKAPENKTDTFLRAKIQSLI